MYPADSCARRSAFFFAAIATALLISGKPSLAKSAAWDFEPKPIARIPAGVVVGGQEVEGWSHPVLYIEGRLSHGDTDSVSATVEKYAELFDLVVLANVEQRGPEDYYLDKVAIGFATPINGKNVVITTDTHKQQGASLGMIGGMVFSANEAALEDTKQVARYSHGLVMDAPTRMNVGGKHQLRMVRHFFWVSKKTGQLGVLVWAMDGMEGDGPYQITEPLMQLLPPNMHEEREMHVEGDEFNFMGLPSEKAFALMRIPQGREIPMSAELQQAAAVRRFDRESYIELLKKISVAVQK